MAKAVKILLKYRVDNAKATTAFYCLFKDVKESQFNGKKYLWPNAPVKYLYRPFPPVEAAAEEGSYLFFYVSTGSHKHVYFSFAGLFKVVEGAKVNLHDGAIQAENLELLEEFGNTVDYEVQIKNAGYEVARHAVKAYLNIAAWLAKCDMEAEKEVQIEVPEPEPVQEASSTSNTVEELELEEVAPTPTPAQAPTAKGLVPIYVLTFNFPSGYLATTSISIESSRETREFDAKAKSLLEGLRARCYREAKKIYHLSDLGWITVSEEGIKVAEQLNRNIVNSLEAFLKVTSNSTVKARLSKAIQRRAFVKAIKVFLNVEDAKQLLQQVIEDIKKDEEEWSKKLEEADKEAKKRQIQNYLSQLIKKRQLFENALKSLSS